MKRLVYVLIALAAFASIASAQPRPGLMPAGPITPQGQGNIVYYPIALPWGWGVGWGYQTYNPWTGFRYTYGGVLPATAVPMAPATTNVTVAPSRRVAPVVVLAQEFPATLALQFPAAAEVWLDGKKVGTSAKEEQLLKSPVLKPTQTYTFLVKARWTQGGKTYEAKRAVTLGPGEHSRLLIVSGDEARAEAPPPKAVSDGGASLPRKRFPWMEGP
jgi:hypothetical protein